MLVPLDMAIHDCDGATQPECVRGLHDLEPLAGLDLVRADYRTNLVVEDLGGGTGQGTQPGGFQLAKEVGDRAPKRLRSLPDLKRRERVDVDFGHRLLDGAADREIGRAGVFRVDT